MATISVLGKSGSLSARRFTAGAATSRLSQDNKRGKTRPVDLVQVENASPASSAGGNDTLAIGLGKAAVTRTNQAFFALS
ncbi:MAG: hypothetical protein ABSF63_04740 [Candidatus Bathyarchaeia archaeon]